MDVTNNVLQATRPDTWPDKASKVKRKWKLLPIQITSSGRFKRSAIINGLNNYNKIHPDIRGMDPVECSEIIKKTGDF